MSTKLENKKLLSKNVVSSKDYSLAESNFSFSSYQSELDGNIKALMKKFPLTDYKKVKSLLEELDNNLEIAVEIMAEEN